MATSAPHLEAPRAIRAWTRKGRLHVELADGRELACPLSFFPRLAKARREDLEDVEFTGRGTGLHWPRLDEDLSVGGLLRGELPAAPGHAKLRERGAFLKAARRCARLTQGELAERLGRSQTLVSQAERGKIWTGAPYRLEVLRACGLPMTWRPSRK